jgi:hypothetical protein
MKTPEESSPPKLLSPNSKYYGLEFGAEILVVGS